MVRSPSFDSNGMKKGAWSKDEDNKLRAFVLSYGHWNWRLLPKYAGLKRCGKSCRLRWVNHLKPGVRRGNFTKEEEGIIIKLHAQLGNKWSAIAAELPGRTDNDIKNFWHTRIARKRKPNPCASEASSMDHQFEMARDQSTDSLIQFQQSTPAFDANSFVIPVSAQPQIESCFPPLIEEEFCYPGLNYSELSRSNESLMEMDALDWIRDQGSIWDDSFALSSLEGNGGIFDPVFCLWN